MESEHSVDIFDFHTYILDFSFWLLLCWCSYTLSKKRCKCALGYVTKVGQGSVLFCLEGAVVHRQNNETLFMRCCPWQ